jgi:DNA-binding PadR family transcriptional regulator
VLLETAVLIALLEEDSHGYSLIDEIGVLVDRQVCVDPGSVYRLLRAMEQDGLVDSSWQPAAAGPSRRTYVITRLGRTLLAERAHSLRQRASSMLELADKAERSLSSDNAGHQAG